ncbi:MAG: PspC domain-containing protein [Candidatus Marinimicrobia bacterium]|nr:PspC domain-containing protein [Candidatus Neomarinimicrobiota bacterium]
MKKYYRSREDNVIAGVCGGVAELFSVDPNLVRLGLVFVALLTHIFPAVITYVAAWIILPEGKPEQPT